MLAFYLFSNLSLHYAQSIRGKLPKIERERLTQKHALFNWLAVISALVGAVVIFVNKENSKKKHWQTIHSYFGTATITLYLFQSFGGVVLYQTPKLFKYIKFHRLNGYAVYLAMTATHGSAVIFGYAGFKDYEFARYFMLALLAVTGILAMRPIERRMLPSMKKSRGSVERDSTRSGDAQDLLEHE